MCSDKMFDCVIDIIFASDSDQLKTTVVVFLSSTLTP